MPVKFIHTYLVKPAKGIDEAEPISGSSVPLKGKLFIQLSQIYDKADQECDSEIMFEPNEEGEQQNDCRDLILEYMGGPTIVRGRKIAERLGSVTTHRSGLGLLFLIVGEENRKHKLIISRFPADSGFLAQESSQNLSVEFLERVFMKSATAYKAAVYEDGSLSSGFWMGKAVDKQINFSESQLSQYWIFDFLKSDFRTTSAAGTKRLALALRNAARHSSSVNVKSEIAAAVTLAGNLKGQRLSASQFVDRFNLSPEAREAVIREMPLAETVEERFQFDLEEFKNQVPYRSVELDSGALLTAETGDFDNVFQRDAVEGNKVRYSTVGRVISEKLGKAK